MLTFSSVGLKVTRKRITSYTAGDSEADFLEVDLHFELAIRSTDIPSVIELLEKFYTLKRLSLLELSDSAFVRLH